MRRPRNLAAHVDAGLRRRAIETMARQMLPSGACPRAEEMLCFQAVIGAPRSVNTGTAASLWHYDEGADAAIGTTITRGRCGVYAPTSRLSLQSGYGILCHNPVPTFERPKRVPMPTRNVVLTERQEELLETLVKSGRYQNASEVLRDGLRLVEQREAEDAGKLKALRAAARAGVGALDRGDFKEFGNIEELQTYLNDLSEKVISRTAE